MRKNQPTLSCPYFIIYEALPLAEGEEEICESLVQRFFEWHQHDTYQFPLPV